MDRLYTTPVLDEHGIDTEKVRGSVTRHVAAILDTIENRTGEIPSGAWWDHALMVAGHPRWDPTTTSTLHLTPHEDRSPGHAGLDDRDTAETDLDGLRPLIAVLVAVSLAAFILAAVALVAAF